MIAKVKIEMIKYFENDVKRINHALKVFEFANIISKMEHINTKLKNIVNYCAILHDIGIKEAEKKYSSSSGKHQKLEGPPIAKKIMSDLNIPTNIIKRVCFIIAHHHTYSEINAIDFQIFVEADFLVNVYEDELDLESIKNIKNKIFKTKYGIQLLESMYL